MQGCVVGKSYLDTREDIVFRSPGVNPKLIRGGGRVYTEVGYALEMAKCKKIGVTGSDGKTTTVTLIHQMLRAGGKGAYLCGNIGYPAIDAAAVACSEDYMVAELSSFQLMDMAPCLDVAAVTNISQNHLDWHADMDEYICAKKNIVKNASLAVLNYDDFVVRSFEAEKKIYFSLGDRRDLVLKGQDFVHVVHGNVCYNECVLFPVSHVKLRGEYNLQNVLCAIGCTHGIVDGQSCHRVAKEFCGVGFRGECVGVKNGVAFINSAIDTTPTRTKNTLSAFDITKVIAILGGYDKNLDYSCLKEALAGAKAVILCGENREKIGAAVKRRVINVNTLNEAVDVAKSLASQGDFVILTPASASFDMFKDYKEKGRCFTSACDLALS